MAGGASAGSLLTDRVAEASPSNRLTQTRRSAPLPCRSRGAGAVKSAGVAHAPWFAGQRQPVSGVHAFGRVVVLPFGQPGGATPRSLAGCEVLAPGYADSSSAGGRSGSRNGWIDGAGTGCGSMRPNCSRLRVSAAVSSRRGDRGIGSGIRTPVLTRRCGECSGPPDPTSDRRPAPPCRSS